MKNFIWSLILVFAFQSCARVGQPVGGDKDTIPPRFLGANIDSTRVKVPRNIREIKLKFNEYIKLKDIQKNLIISPPIKKITKIIPTNLPTKFVSIQFEDTLQENTTYQFNFGNAIQDNNEANVLRYFNFAFSTGEKIDSTYISGEVKDAFNIDNNTKANQNKTVVGLYQYKDSIDYKKKPYYISRVDDDGYFELEYLTQGNYKLIAFSDDNENSIYDAGAEKIGFQKEPLTIDKSISKIKMTLSPSQKKVKYLETKTVEGGILVLFEGDPKAVKIASVEESLGDFKVRHRQYSDSVKVWLKPFGKEQKKSKRLQFSYQIGTKKDTVSTYYKPLEKVEMTIQNKKGNKIPPKKEFIFASNFEIDKIDPQKWSLKKDSTEAIQFEAKIVKDNPYQVVVNADFKEGEKYQLTVPKESVASYFEKTNKSYRFDFEIDKSDNFGKCEFRLKNPPSSKFWFQLLDAQKKVKFEQYTNAPIIKFDLLPAEQYYVRILVDENENEFWDKANLEKQIFAEKSYIFYKILTIRPLWEMVEDWDLTTDKKLKAKIRKAPTKKMKNRLGNTQGNDTNGFPNNGNNNSSGRGNPFGGGLNTELQRGF
ncbi:MAG: hypothetical protein CSA38_03105 [Flavobacteriales bacterium]|nr:MAG: hypothetical protein CSA38_03105 [Flavobacteriales bacterium]